MISAEASFDVTLIFLEASYSKADVKAADSNQLVPETTFWQLVTFL